jgi:hypothetical protein
MGWLKAGVEHFAGGIASQYTITMNSATTSMKDLTVVYKSRIKGKVRYVTWMNKNASLLQT